MLVNSFTLDSAPLDGAGSSVPVGPSSYCINGAPLNAYPINGPGSHAVTSGMSVQVVDCRNLIVNFTVGYDHFRVLNHNNWGLSLGGWINRVVHIEGDYYAVNTTRTFAGVTYTLIADV